MSDNIDHDVVAGFGDEWSRFHHGAMPEQELQELFAAYFTTFPWHQLSAEALSVARRNLAGIANSSFLQASANSMRLLAGAADYGCALGVLHHVPDTPAALKTCVAKRKSGVPFLVYLHYALDNKPAWYRALWRASDIVRRAVSRAPSPLRYVVSQGLSAMMYWSAARTALLPEKASCDADALPLSMYRKRSFYVMRTYALDRFGTRLERRFTRSQIATMMSKAGLAGVVLCDARPFRCALGDKR